MRILLVDDSRTMRAIERNILQKMGYSEIEEARDGHDALSRVAAFRPHLMVVDRTMPSMDGLTLVRTLRSSGNRTAVLFVTNEADKNHILDAVKAGVTNCLVTPFTPDAFEERIRATLMKVEVA